MAHSRIALLVIGVILISQAAPVAATPAPEAAPPVAQSTAGPVCNGKYKDFLKPSFDELAEIFKKHAAWMKAGGVYDPKLADDPRKANLCGADLRDTDLTKPDLSSADLTGAILWRAHLDYANLTDAHLDHATLWGADLFGADLRGADLIRADLRGADLSFAQVSKAKLAGVDMTGAIYAPMSEPPDPYVAGIQGLATVIAAPGEEIGLIQLRKLLRDAGLSDSATEATFAIQRNITRDQLSSHSPRSARIEGCLRTVGLEWTTAYGLHPERALRWILLLGAVLTPVYMLAILRPTAASGVIQVFPADRLEGTAGDPADEQKREKQLVHAKGWRDAVSTAAYFSLISAVNIGFEAFTPGDWIRRLQTREYSLEAVGWVRVVAGAQALLSVYLLAMWVLTQFGQPFE
jgi:hypothetical protein